MLSPEPTQEQRQSWAELLRRLRYFFDQRQFLEITTPCLVTAGAFESVIDPLRVQFSDGAGQLHTSPEIEMKHVISRLKQSVFQISPCFRDDPPSPIHRREFTMLEFYEVGGNADSVIELMKELVETALGKPLEWEQFTVRELFQRHAGLDLFELQEPDHLKSAIEATQLTRVGPDDTWEDLFFRVMMEKVEPALHPTRPTIVTHYPRQLSALAKTAEAHTCERFEIYWHGVELCNGASELSDGDELRRRFELEQHKRVDAGKALHPEPTRLFEALAVGLPECGGVAVGLDRLALLIERARVAAADAESSTPNDE